MRKSTRSTLFLAFAVTLLAVAVYAELIRERAMLPAALTTLNPATVQTVQVQCNGCVARKFERTPHGWRMLEPFALPANADAVVRLLAVARAPVRERLHLRDYDLAKLGLAPAQITLTLDATVIEIGGEDPIDHDRYVRVGNELLRVPDRFSARLLETPESEVADPSAIPKS